MHVVDTCGWIEWLTDGALAENFAPFLADSANLVVPTLVQFEIYKWCLREKDKAAALDVSALLKHARCALLTRASRFQQRTFLYATNSPWRTP